MLIRIDPTREEPVFAQIAASVRGDIASGRVAPGERLPAAKQVASALGVNAHTVLHAYQELRDEGLVDMRPGRGAVVTQAAAAAAALHDDIAALVMRAKERGVSVDMLVSLIRSAPHA